MNTFHHITNQAELEQLIDRYFDGETSVQEEQLLRKTLANCTWSSETIDEARFTMGYFVAHCQQQLALIENDLNAMDEASNGMSAQLSNLGEALELDNN